MPVLPVIRSSVPTQSQLSIIRNLCVEVLVLSDEDRNQIQIIRSNNAFFKHFSWILMSAQNMSIENNFSINKRFAYLD